MNIKDTGIIYRNPKPHVASRQAYFPSVVDLGEGELLCSFVIGQAFESADCRIHLARSRDYGDTWHLEGRMLPEENGKNHSESCRIARCSDGSLAANVFRHDRRRLDEGLANPETLGFVETEISIHRSQDKGKTWGNAEPVHTPLVGPEFELCSPVVELQDGRWLLPTSTWKAWDGSNPTGMKAVALISHDAGKTWPEYVDVMNGIESGVIYWEQKIVEMAPGRLLSIAWAYDERNGRDLPNAYCLSEDAGKSFSRTQSTGLCGQTAALLPLGKTSILCVYRRTDTPGLWAAQVSIEDGDWKTAKQFRLWGAPEVFGGGHSDNMVKKFNVLKFGAPCITRLDDGEIYVVFWCVEDCISNIRWIKLEEV